MGLWSNGNIQLVSIHLFSLVTIQISIIIKQLSFKSSENWFFFISNVFIIIDYLFVLIIIKKTAKKIHMHITVLSIRLMDIHPYPESSSKKLMS